MCWHRCGAIAGPSLSFRSRKSGRLGPNIALSSARGARDRADEQAARLSTARWRHGYGRGQRNTGIRGGRARLRFFRANIEKTWRKKNPAAFEQPGKSAATRAVWDSRCATSSLPAAHIENFPRLSADKKKQDVAYPRRLVRQPLAAADELDDFVAVVRFHRRLRPRGARKNLEIALDGHAAGVQPERQQQIGNHSAGFRFTLFSIHDDGDSRLRYFFQFGHSFVRCAQTIDTRVRARN